MQATTAPHNKAERYRGPDRRNRFARTEPLPPRPLTVAVLVFTAALLAGSYISPAAGALQHVAHLDGAAGALSIVAGVATMFRWRFDGRAPSWWIGLALIVYGTPGLLSTSSDDLRFALAASTSLVCVAFLFGAVRSTDVDSGLSITWAAWALAGALVVVGAATTVGWFAPVVARAGAGMSTVGFGVIAVTWYRRRKLESWLVVPLVGFTCAAFLLTFIGTAAARDAAAECINLVATALAITGALTAMQASASAQRAVAFAAQRERDLADSRRVAIAERYAETLHEVRSTVVAIEGGIRTLQPQTDAAESNTDLARALVSELHRLRDLVEPQNASGEAEFSVLEILEPLLTVTDAGGWVVRWDIPDNIRARGRGADAAQIVHALMMNARRYAPGSAIEVTARAMYHDVVVYVEDRGAGVPPDDLERIFERGERSDHRNDPDGHGLGLHIARQLAHDLGGDLWAEERPGGGARFVLSLRTAMVVGPRGRVNLVPT